jgi:hypothetical protein
MVLDTQADELPKDITLIIFHERDKSRIAARLLLDELKRKGYMSKHAVSEYAGRLACPQKSVFTVTRNWISIASPPYERRTLFGKLFPPEMTSEAERVGDS